MKIFKTIGLWLFISTTILIASILFFGYLFVEAMTITRAL